jgi:hypothetical protein
MPVYQAVADGHPRWKGDPTERHYQQTWLSYEDHLDLNKVATELGVLVPALMRRAIDGILDKLDHGATPKMPDKPSRVVSEKKSRNQRTLIERQKNRQLEKYAFQHHCTASDLVREGVHDLLATFPHILPNRRRS